jgi:hypothetical protein
MCFETGMNLHVLRHRDESRPRCPVSILPYDRILGCGLSRATALSAPSKTSVGGRGEAFWQSEPRLAAR